MNLRKKLLLGIGLALIITYTLVALFSYQAMDASYLVLERHEVIKAAGTSDNAMETDLKNAYAVARDYSAWTDTVRFAEGRNPGWVDQNMDGDFFTRFNVDTILVFNRSGELIFARENPDHPSQAGGIPPLEIQKIQDLNTARNILSSSEGSFEILDSPAGPVILASHPILTDDFVGPVAGSLHIIRRIDAKYLDDLSLRTGNRVALIHTSSLSGTASLTGSLAGITRTQPVAVIPENGDRISGYSYPSGLDSPGSYYLKVTIPRDIYRTGQANTTTFLLSLLGAWVCITLFILLFVDRVILSRLNTIIGTIRHRKASGNNNGGLEGRDELAQLAFAIDPIFAELAESRIQLQESEERYRMLAESAHDLIFTIDSTGRITYVNTRVAEVFGQTKEEIVNRPCTTLFPGESGSKMRENIARVLSSGETEAGEYSLPLPGGERWQDTILIPYKDNGGRVTGVLGISRDITLRKQAEQALVMANKKLNLLSITTRHDILTQLTALRTYIELSREQVKDETVLDFIENAENIAKTINRQICFTRDYQGMGDKKPVWQNVCTSIIAISHTLPLGSVKIRVGFSDLEVYADPMFEKVFYNLIDNTLRHGGKKRSVMTFSCERSGTGCVIICEDDGIGVPDENKNRIFEQGFGSNTGLGLFLSKEILDITDISITENGIPGKGARFEILVPEGRFRFTGAEGEHPNCSLDNRVR
ncbi:CHASE4 domain-containing protein [Methanoregula sp.]|uniref:CHASE4 domain-containing protein n=1 Tax=Methanoregula sp. TaxID=2052170 RepID=UPI0035644F79